MLKTTCTTCSIHVTERKKRWKGIHKGKYATYIVFACMYKQEKARVQKTEYTKERFERNRKKEKNIRNQIQKYSSRVFLFTHVVAAGRKESGVRLIKIRIASYILPRDVHRCIFVFLMGNVPRGEAYNISTYSGNIDFSLFDRLCFWHWYNLNLISFDSIKWNCYIYDFTCVTYYLNMQLLNMHFEYHNF